MYQFLCELVGLESLPVTHYLLGKRQNLLTHLLTYCVAGARVGDGAGDGAASARRLTEVTEKARPSSAGSDTSTGRESESSGPLERHDR